MKVGRVVSEIGIRFDGDKLPFGEMAKTKRRWQVGTSGVGLKWERGYDGWGLGYRELFKVLDN